MADPNPSKLTPEDRAAESCVEPEGLNLGYGVSDAETTEAQRKTRKLERR